MPTSAGQAAVTVPAGAWPLMVPVQPFAPGVQVAPSLQAEAEAAAGLAPFVIAAVIVTPTSAPA